MKVSAIICSLQNGPERMGELKRCLKSLKGYDELIVMPVQPNSLGYCEAWNTAFELATGDYLIVVSDDHILKEGSLEMLCVPDAVTSPTGLEVGDGDFWGGMFCLPRSIYEKVGLYDMRFNGGIHYMDTDLQRRLDKEGVLQIRIRSVVVDHDHPGRTLQRVDGYESKVMENRRLFNEKWSK